MTCIPCAQEIIWSERIKGMVAAVDVLVANPDLRPSETLIKDWYEALEKSCEIMQPVLDRIAAEKGHAMDKEHGK